MVAIDGQELATISPLQAATLLYGPVGSIRTVTFGAAARLANQSVGVAVEELASAPDHHALIGQNPMAERAVSLSRMPCWTRCLICISKVCMPYGCTPFSISSLKARVALGALDGLAHGAGGDEHLGDERLTLTVTAREKALGDDALNGVGDAFAHLVARSRLPLGSEREHAAEGAHDVWRVERGEHEVTRLGRLERDVHRLLVAESRPPG